MDHSMAVSKQKQTAADQLQYNCKQYDKIRVLGKGSFGTAVVHRRRADCSLVVLKEIDLQQFKGDKEKCSALNEAKIMSSLNHINIIKYHNAYLTDTKLLIEMEYASMGTLANYLSLQTNPLHEYEILVIFKQIVSGLSYLHEKNIVHLDLKMANIFITIDGLVKIGDFGIAQYMQQKPTSQQNSSSIINPHHQHHHHHYSNHRRPLEQRRNSAAVTTGAGAGAISSSNRRSLHRHSNGAGGSQFAGTLAYSSPERCLGQATDFKSDIWSLGCILYELITSKPLFSGESLPEIVMRITRIQYAPIRRDSSISSELRRSFEQTISRKPNERPTARELQTIIDELLNLQAASSNQQNHQQRNGNKIRKRRNNGLNLSTDAANYIHINNNDHNNNNNNNKRDLAQLRYPHSLIYQVRLDSHHIQIDRVNLPLTKRIKELCKGKSHYLVLTYDNIVFGWGSRSHGELGSCGLGSSAQSSALICASGLSSSPIRTNINQRETKSTSNELAATATSSRQLILEAKSSRDNNNVTSHGITASATSPKAFIINELNHRKIIQVAAGNDFSVFLSKTGIVMTCGDGSGGCLGRGNFKSSFTPCMVESLLNTDIVSIASGPEHVVAVCGNGKAFAWGNSTKGRLGIGTRDLTTTTATTNCSAGNLNRSSNHLSGSAQLVVQPDILDYSGSSSKFVSVPHPVKFTDDSVFIKNAFCGDKCTIFIDSKNRCWACGENKFNKLGLDIKRRFKKTLIVDKSWYPIEIITLSKHQIISCNIGKNHSTFIASDGRLFVYGQDIDQAYRLRRNIINGIDSHRKISFELHTTGNNRNRYRSAMNNNRQRRSTMKLKSSNLVSPRLDLRKLAKSTVINNQSSEFKQSKDDLLSPVSRQRKSQNKANDSDSNNYYPKYSLTKLQRQQVDTFLKKSRSTKKMSFECVIASSCTRKFTLALTNDNRIYFWGTRSYSRNENEFKVIRTDDERQQQQNPEPQLIPADLDECFVKIGATNRSLMTTIQALGSDQPIVHGRDPRLTANTLADLWILDYKPSSSVTSSSASSSSRSESLSSIMDDSDNYSTSSELQQSCCSSCCSAESNPNYDLKHDAILDPQPIVSLYVPSMFNHSGCSLQLVDLFCYDEDKFYLVLDTTVKMHHLTAANSGQQQQQQQQQQSSNHQQQMSQYKQNSGRDIEQQVNNNQSKRLSPPACCDNSPNQNNHNKNANDLSEGKHQLRRQSIKDGSEANTKLMGGNLDNNKQMDAMIKSSKQQTQTQDGRVRKNSIESHHNKVEDGLRVIVQNIDDDRESASNDNEISSSIATTDDNNNIVDEDLKTAELSLGQSPNRCDHGQLLMVVGASLDEPRSMSTFVANSMGNQIIVGPSMRLATVGNDQMEPLNFSDSLEDQKSSSEINDGSGQHQYEQRNQEEQSSASSNTTLEGGAGLKLADQSINKRRKSRQMRDPSESTTSFTCNETSSMPSWVRNEYNLQQQQGQQQPQSSSSNSSQRAGDDFMFVIDSSSASERTCITKQPLYIGASESEARELATEDPENRNEDDDNNNGLELMVDVENRCDDEIDITPRNSLTSVRIREKPDDADSRLGGNLELDTILATSSFLSQSQPNIRGNQDNGTNFSRDGDQHQVVINDNPVLTTRRSFATLSQQAGIDQEGEGTNSIADRQANSGHMLDHCDAYWNTTNRTTSTAAQHNRTNLQTSIVNISGLSTRSSSNNPLIGSPNSTRRSELPLGGLDGRYTGMREVIDSNHLDENAHLWPSNSNLHDGLQRSSSSINEVTRFQQQQQQQQTTSKLSTSSMLSKSVQQLNVNQKFRGHNNKLTNGSVNSVASSIRKSLLKLFC